MGPLWSLCVPIGFNVYLWVLMHPYGSLWIPMGPYSPYGSILVFIGLYACLWILVGSCGSL